MTTQMSVPIKAALSELRREREKLERQIHALEGAIVALSGDESFREVTGPPPSEDGQGRTRRRRRKPMTDAQKKAVSVRMKAMWAKRRRARSKSS